MFFNLKRKPNETKKISKNLTTKLKTKLQKTGEKRTKYDEQQVWDKNIGL